MLDHPIYVVHNLLILCLIFHVSLFFVILFHYNLKSSFSQWNFHSWMYDVCWFLPNFPLCQMFFLNFCSIPNVLLLVLPLCLRLIFCVSVTLLVLQNPCLFSKTNTSPDILYFSRLILLQTSHPLNFHSDYWDLEQYTLCPSITYEKIYENSSFSSWSPFNYVVYTLPNLISSSIISVP